MNMLQLLTIILPIIALFCVLLIAFINAFITIRKLYPAKVNCWFCNSYSKVKYEERNSFYCSSCHQYNGFNEDGDYNKLIPEQHDVRLNNPPSLRYVKRKSTNGLCRFCNNNQQLKIHQLAAFVPLNESSYDREIEHFTCLLEKAYKLCPKCDQVLHHTLTEQNKQLIGQKILSMHRKSMAFLDLNTPSKHITIQQKKVFFNFFLHSTLILISILLLTESIQSSNISDSNVKLPGYLQPIISRIYTYFDLTIRHYFEWVNNIREVKEVLHGINSTFSPVKIIMKDILYTNLTHNQYVEYLSNNISNNILNRVSLYDMSLTVCGLFLQLSTFLLRKHNVYSTVLWILLLIVPYISFQTNNALIIKVLLLVSIIYKTFKNRRHKNKTLKESKNLNDSSIYSDHFTDSTNSFNNSSFYHQNSSRISNAKLNTGGYSIKSSILQRNSSPISSPSFGAKGVLCNPLSFKSFKIDEEANIIQNGLKNLSLGKINRQKQPSNVFRTKPVLSPANFLLNNNKKQQSLWCTDNWLKQSAVFNSRCSSQTSGFVSIAPNDLNLSQNSLSLPDSASSSVSGDFDRASVISEPLNASFSSAVLGNNGNRSTASPFSSLMNKSFNVSNRHSNGSFKPIV